MEGSWKVTEAWDGTPAAAPSAAASAARAQSPPPDAAAGGGTGSEVRGQSTRSEVKIGGGPFKGAGRRRMALEGSWKDMEGMGSRDAMGVRAL